ncbi:hypothetical protein C0991_011377 [Blastosporella zonata]|nr:hypothetical protein C0991_011377 [Blastosporella zonata]
MMRSYATIALLLCTTTTHAAPLASNHAELNRRDVIIFRLLGQPIHDPCATYRSLKEKNEGCETETLLYFSALFSDYCPSESRLDGGSTDNSILQLFGRDSDYSEPHRRHHPGNRLGRRHHDITSFEQGHSL